MNRYYEELQTRLKKRRSDGWTNQRMAELGDTSQAHINRLLNGNAVLSISTGAKKQAQGNACSKLWSAPRMKNAKRC